jgi:S1-C subfamily serine protease
MVAWRKRWRVVCLLLASCCLKLPPPVAHADPIPDSLSAVGAWRVAAHSRGKTLVFDRCIAERVQRDGFAILLGYTAQGFWTLDALAPDWGLTVSEYYTVKIVVGPSDTYTFNGKAFHSRGMGITAAPELFDQLKSGAQLALSANEHRFTMTLDGVEAAMARAKECTAKYASRPTVPPAGTPPSTTPPTASPSTAPAAQPGAASAAPSPPAAPASPPAAVSVSTGTGFFIGTNTIVSNFHVINGCQAISIGKNGGGLGAARVVAASQSDDLVALQTAAGTKSILKLRAGTPIRPAESVLVFGYPLSGALSSAGNTTLGNVTALSGLRDDSRYIQISAAVQPGNSGGPVIDESGRLMGVVVSKLNAAAVARVTGDIPQNVNFAIKASTLQNFLESKNIPYETDGNFNALSSTERAARAEASSVQIVCRKQAPSH